MRTEAEYNQLLNKYHTDMLNAQTKMAEAVTQFTSKILPDDVVWLQMFCALANRQHSDATTSVEWADYGLAEYTKRFKDITP